MSGVRTDAPLAVVVARGGALPAGADEAAAEAGGRVLVVGDGAHEAAKAVVAAERVWWADTGPGLRPAALAAVLAADLAGAPLVVLPGSPDGRDLAPRLAAALGRPLLAQCVRVKLLASEHRSARAPGSSDASVSADLTRLDGRVLVGVSAPAPAVATLVPGSRTAVPVAGGAGPRRVRLPDPPADLPPDPELIEIEEPDPATVDLADARRVFTAGAGLAAGRGGDEAQAPYDAFGRVAAAMGASPGATRVVTDAGWMPYDRQIGTTGVAVDPDLYVAFGVSGASQHTGGLGTPAHVVSVNTDPSCPMTALADLGLVTDAYELLAELDRRHGNDDDNGNGNGNGDRDA